MIKKKAKYTLIWSAAVILLAGLLGGCANGPSAPEREPVTDFNHYLKVLRKNTIVYDTFQWNTMSSALIVRALPLNSQVSQAAGLMFKSDPSFQKESQAWTARTKTGQAPVVILFGIYTPDLNENDLTKAKRFRPRLKTGHGRYTDLVEIKRYGRDHVFIRDHFPIFNHWEEVYMLKFLPSGLSSDDRLEFVVEWPGGEETLILNAPRVRR